MHRKRMGIRILCRVLLSHVIKIFLWGTILCFRKVWLSKNFIHKRAERGGKEHHNFSSEICCLKVLKNILCSGNFLVTKKFMDKGGGERECRKFPSRICCLTVVKCFVEEPFCASETFWYRKIFWIRGTCQEFLSNIFYLLVSKNLLCFEKSPVSKKIMDKSGKGGGREYHISFRKFVKQYQKTS